MGRSFRALRPGDAREVAAVARLCGQLGYPATPEPVAARLAALAADERNGLFVAVDGEDVVGWIHVQQLVTPVDEPFALITGLIVDESVRGTGVGARLVAAAEEWARGRGVGRMVVRSRVSREGAHRFYARLGYEERKRQVVFRRWLRGRGG